MFTLENIKNSEALSFEVMWSTNFEVEMVKNGCRGVALCKILLPIDNRIFSQK